MRENRIKLLISIVNDDLEHNITEELRKYKIPFHLIVNGKGTASPSLLDYFGIEGSKRSVTFAIIPESLEIDLLYKVYNELKFKEPGYGVAFTLPISSSSKYLSDNLKEVVFEKEVTSMKSDKEYHLIFAIVQDGLKRALAEPAKIREGDAFEIEKLSEGLLLSGFAMQAIQSSRPASGIEHQFSHYWDMSHLKHNGESISHGFKVGIGTLVSTAFLEMLLQEDIDACVANWKSLDEFKKDIENDFNHEADFVARGITEMTDKYVDKEGLRVQLESFKANWSKLKARLEKQILPFKQVQESLKLVGAPYEPEHIGVSREKLLATCKIIPYMRSRISSADIAVRAGLFDKWLDKLFGKGGIWEIK